MANQMGWREAWGAAWNKLTGVDNEGSAAGVRLLFFLLFLLGTLGAGYRYYEMQLLGQEKTFVPSTTPQKYFIPPSAITGILYFFATFEQFIIAVT